MISGQCADALCGGSLDTL